jgi:hypothetical protein
MTTAVVCRCGVVLSRDGLRWCKQGYRLSRRYIDGTPIRGTISRPDIRGARPLCRACVDAAVTDAREIGG